MKPSKLYNTDLEAERLNRMKQYETEAFHQGYNSIAGTDEVGRGALAGPVVAAAVILPNNFYLPGVDDSKKLACKKRIELAAEIKRLSVAWAVAYVYPPFLDRINILNATKKAMVLAVAQLNPVPDYLLVDALKLPGLDIQQRSIIKGDSLSISIAAASIIAKVERDSSMEFFDILYPDYGFAKHKGYGTRAHFEALFKTGACSLHRQSFEPVKSLDRNGINTAQNSLFK